MHVWKAMPEMAVPATAAPGSLLNALHWLQACSVQSMGFLIRKHSHHHKPIPIQHLSAVIARVADNHYKHSKVDRKSLF